MIKTVKKAVFPVGGLGTRFLPATKSMPKEMLTVVDKPLIQYAFEEAKDAGIEEFIFITGRNKNIISNHFDHAYELQSALDKDEKKHLLSLTKDWLPKAGSIAFIRQQDPLGLGHAVYSARNFIGDEPFAVLLADDMFLSEKPLLSDLMETYEKFGGNVLGVAEIDKQDASKYGIVEVENDDGKCVKISDMVEKPPVEEAPSNISIVGRYILQPEIFDHLEKNEGGKDQEIQLTDSLVKMIKNTPTHGVRVSGQRFDCGSKRGFVKANVAFALNNPEMRDDILDMLKKLV